MEDTAAVPSIYQPFIRRKLAGRIAGRFLYPGWGSGMLFVFVVLAVLLWSAPIHWGNSGDFSLVAGLEAIFAPLALARFLCRKGKKVVPYFFGLQVMLFVTAILVSVNDVHSRSHLATFAGMFPTIGFFLGLWRDASILSSMVPVCWAITLLSLGGLFVLSIKEWKLIGAMERAAASLEKEG
jgi:hypothetical protein